MITDYTNYWSFSKFKKIDTTHHGTGNYFRNSQDIVNMFSISGIS